MYPLSIPFRVPRDPSLTVRNDTQTASTVWQLHGQETSDIRVVATVSAFLSVGFSLGAKPLVKRVAGRHGTGYVPWVFPASQWKEPAAYKACRGYPLRS